MSRPFNCTLFVWLCLLAGHPLEMVRAEDAPPPAASRLFTLRWFAEPLVPTGPSPSSTDADALWRDVEGRRVRFQKGEKLTVLRELASAHSDGAYGAALLTNLGIEEFQNGFFSRAMASWDKAWQKGKGDTSFYGKAVVDRALAELVRMHARIGHFPELKKLFQEIEGRELRGMPQEVVEATRTGYWGMLHKPEESFRCGPAALGKIWLRLHPQTTVPTEVARAQSTQRGLSLLQVRDLSRKVGINYQAVKRQPGSAWITPCVANWKLEHYGALVEEKDGKFLLEDSTFGPDVRIWMSAVALEEESSGYFLVPEGALPSGWSPVSDDDAARVWGRGNTSLYPPGATGPGDPKAGGDSGGGGGGGGGGDHPKCEGKGEAMASWTFHLSVASLSVFDTPLFYDPPTGPGIAFAATYNQRETNQPASPLYSNLGTKWNFEWVQSLTFGFGSAYVNEGGGGFEEFSNFNAGTQTYGPGDMGAATLVSIAADQYELREPDGSRRVFDLPDGTGRIFMSRQIDPQGNALQFTYDANFRLISVTDAISQVTTLTHGSNNVLDPMFYRVTRVTDPFGRFAQLDYDGTARITKITDMIGLTSEFTYDAGDFLQTLTTGYGVTSFAWGEAGFTRWVEATHPNGDMERVESINDASPAVASSDPAATVPAGMATYNSSLQNRNSFYWDRKACKAGLSYANARLYHFIHYVSLIGLKGRQIESSRAPHEGRVWFNYRNQSSPTFFTQGMVNQPTKIGRVLDAGEVQLISLSYNAQGRVTESIDPLGRTTQLTYEANGLDVAEVRQSLAGNTTERLLAMTWNGQHLPLTVTDAAGQTTTFTYNARGQALTVTNAKNEVTTLNYNASGYLTSVDGPLPGTADSITFTYGAFGLVRTMTDTEGYTITHDYDALNRLTRVTYPDTTFQEVTWTLLNVATLRDRRGRITSYDYNSLRQRVKETDPLNRVTRYDWCRCGALKSLIDPMGRETRWEYDLEGRNTAKVYPDNSRVSYVYETMSSRLKSETDAKGQTKLFDYFADDQLRNLSYPNALNPTPGVSFTYDPLRGRALTRSDGTGLTRFSYHPITAIPALGADRLAKIDGPLPNDDITYSYDALGRVLSRSIGGVAQSVVYDALGRVTSANNALGAFTQGYVNATGRLASVNYPNGQTTALDYFPNNGDRRLKEIWHKLPGGATLSKFNYTYDAEGQIQTWAQQSDSQPAREWSYGYDLGDQLTSAAATNPSTSFGYSYDPAGNRLTETIGGVPASTEYNALNELVSRTGAATPARTYEWDAEDRLVAIVSGTHRSEFTYDGMHRRVRIVEKDNNVTTSDHRFVWCGMTLCEERNAAGTLVTKRFLPQGVVDAGTALFYTWDHLGSVRELTDGTGTIGARYDYDPYGRRTKVAGALDADVGFTGHYFHQASGLLLAPFRAYQADHGRWLSRDRIEERGGVNLYAYVGNEPIHRFDPLGLKKSKYLPFDDKGLKDPGNELAGINPLSITWIRQFYLGLGIVDLENRLPLLKDDLVYYKKRLSEVPCKDEISKELLRRLIADLEKYIAAAEATLEALKEKERDVRSDYLYGEFPIP